MTTPTNAQIWSELVKLRVNVEEFLQLKTEVEEMVKTREEATRLGLTIQDFLTMRADVSNIRNDQLTGRTQLQEIREEVVANRAERIGEIKSLVTKLEGVERRMTAYEQQASENNQMLKDIKPAVLVIRNSMRVLKWGGLLIATGVLGQVGIYFFHLIAGR